MANDPNAKPPPPPPDEIIVEATDWPPFLQRPSDPREQVRRAQQAVDEQREREHELANKRQTVRGREEKAAKRRREVAIFMKAAEMVAVKKGAWQVAVDALDRANKLLKLDQDYEFDELKNCDPIYRVVRIPSNWSRLTSLR
jgi:hypothetical protein